NATLYLSLLFGWFYLWTVAPNWSVPEKNPIGWLPLLVSGGLLTWATLWFQQLTRRLCKGEAAGLALKLWLVALVGAVHCAALLWVLLSAELQPLRLAHDAVLLVMLLYL